MCANTVQSRCVCYAPDIRFDTATPRILTCAQIVLATFYAYVTVRKPRPYAYYTGMYMYM